MVSYHPLNWRSIEPQNAMGLKLLEQRLQLAQEELIGSSGIAAKSDGDRVVPIGVREE